MRYRVELCALSLLLVLTLTPAAFATDYTYSIIDFPGTTTDRVTGMNGLGQIVGGYFDAVGNSHPFLYSNGTFTPLTIHTPISTPPFVNYTPTSLATSGINNAGLVGGFFGGGNSTIPPGGYGFSGHIAGDSSASLNFLGPNDPATPLHFSTQIYGLNNGGQAVGLNSDANGVHGFYVSGLDHQGITALNSNYNVPGAIRTDLFGINDLGQIVGDYQTPDNVFHGLLLAGGIGGAVTTIDIGVTGTNLTGINDAGVIVGNGPGGGFVLPPNGTPQILTVPGGPFGAYSTATQGINLTAGGQILGFFTDANNQTHGLVATPAGTPVLPTGACSGAFCFDIILPAATIRNVDPTIATGYIFQITSGLFFRSVDLPNIGSSDYMLFLWDGSQFVFDQDLLAGNEFFFAPGGVDRFEIMGIDPGAALDPNDPLAFQVGLSFITGGEENFSMTPLTADVSGTPNVPEPSTWLLLGSGLAGLAVWRRKKAA